MARKTKHKNKQKRKNSKKQNQKRNWFAFLLKWGTVLAIWGTIAVTIIVIWYGAELPQITKNADFTRKATITIQDARGKVINRYGDLKGNTLTIEDIPPHLAQAVIAIEDRRFYLHPGIDPIGIARAIVTNVTGGGVRQGGSTITQQLAKNLFLTHERTYKRKIQEALLALWLEHELSKDEILAAYLNRVYLGGGAYGIDAASNLYFGKPATDINLLESAIIAGLLKAPSRYSPHNNPELSQKRARIVLQSMIRDGHITKDQADNAGDITVTHGLIQPLNRNRARYFTDWVISQLDELIGTIDEDITVTTTLNTRLQTKAEDILDATIAANEDRAVTQGAIIMMRPGGAIVTMVGGRNYSESQFNRATQARRQPGSSFKPIVYLTALEQGWAPDDTIIDEPFDRTSSYRPKNFGNEYFGEVSLLEALTSSLNTVSVRLTQDVGLRKIMNTARRLGITSPLEADLSLALGSSAVAPLEMVTAYAAIANGGFATTPYAITKIQSETTGELYYSRPPARHAKRIIDSDKARDITLMMQSVVENGTGRSAALPGTHAAGKTGTSPSQPRCVGLSALPIRWLVLFGSAMMITPPWTASPEALYPPASGVKPCKAPAAVTNLSQTPASIKAASNLSSNASSPVTMLKTTGNPIKNSASN